jgi:recombinational DNA repair protein RecT
MALKSCIKKLVKYLPISVESQSAISYDETVRKDITADVFTVNDDLISEPDIIEAKEVG